MVVALGRLRQERARDPDAAVAQFELPDRDLVVVRGGVARAGVGRARDVAPAGVLPGLRVDVVLARVRAVGAGGVLDREAERRRLEHLPSHAGVEAGPRLRDTACE